VVESDTIMGNLVVPQPVLMVRILRYCHEMFKKNDSDSMEDGKNIVVVTAVVVPVTPWYM